MATVTDRRPRAGAMLRDWRRRRRISQLDLALAADVSARHLSSWRPAGHGRAPSS